MLGLFADPIRHSVSPTMHNNEMAKLGLNGAKEIRIFNIHDRNWEPAKGKVVAINEATDCVCSLNPMEDKEAFKQSIAESGIYCDATGVGMPPLDDLSLVEDPSWLHEDMVVSDTVYEPRETKLMRIAKEAGIKHIYNGLGMVVGQGAESFKLWTGKEMPVDYIKKIIAKA